MSDTFEVSDTSCLTPLPRTKQQTSNANHITAFFNGNIIIAAHAHAKCFHFVMRNICMIHFYLMKRIKNIFQMPEFRFYLLLIGGK